MSRVQSTSLSSFGSKSRRLTPTINQCSTVENSPYIFVAALLPVEAAKSSEASLLARHAHLQNRLCSRELSPSTIWYARTRVAGNARKSRALVNTCNASTQTGCRLLWQRVPRCASSAATHRHCLGTVWP